jgi:hypothetical protein
MKSVVAALPLAKHGDWTIGLADSGLADTNNFGHRKLFTNRRFGRPAQLEPGGIC